MQRKIIAKPQQTGWQTLARDSVERTSQKTAPIASTTRRPPSLHPRMLSLVEWRAEGAKSPTRTIVRASLTLRAVTSLALLLLGSLLPSFETDAATLREPVAWWARPFVRWDTVHFVNVALGGYPNEWEAAFMPGLPGLMRAGGEVLHWLSRAGGAVSGNEVVVAGLVLTIAATTAAALCLHRCVLLSLSSQPRQSSLTVLSLASPCIRSPRAPPSPS